MNVVLACVGAFGAVLLFQGLTDQGLAAAKESRFSGRLRSAGLRPESARRWIGISVGLGVLSMLLVAGITSSLIVAVPFGIAAGWSPWSLLEAKTRKRVGLQQEEWPDVLAALVAAVRSGSSLPEAMLMTAKRSGARLTPAFDAFTSVLRASGSFAAALEAFRRAAADPVADRLVVVLTMTQEVGGTDLVRVLRTLGDFVRSDQNLRKEIAARLSWTVSAARLAAGAPWLVLLMMSTQPEAARAYGSPTGARVILMGGAATLVGYRLMLRAGRLPSQERVNG